MGNAIFHGLPAPERLKRIFKKFCTIDYVDDPNYFLGFFKVF